jgi:hypothetical protein
MTAGIVLVIALMLLATQLMLQGRTGEWPSITLASKLGIPADRVFSDWIILDTPIRFILHDVQLWTVLLFAAALIYWIMDWTSEMLGRLPKRAPSELQPSPAPQPSPELRQEPELQRGRKPDPLRPQSGHSAVSISE